MRFQKGNKAAKGSPRPPGRTADKLTAQQEQFAREYVVDLDAIRACMKVWKFKSRHNASTKACHVLKMPKVAALVAELKAAQFKRLDLKADDVLQEFMRLADVDPGKLYDADGSMLPVYKLPIEVRRCISSVEYDANGLPKIKFWSKVDALGMLAKHFKVCVERVEVKDVTDRAAALAKALARVRGAADTTPTGAAASPA
jgi:hypothetical protein